MLTLSGHHIYAQIYESSKSLVYRGRRQGDDCPVVVKLLKQAYPSPSDLVRYQREYQLTRSLNYEGVIRAYSLERYQNTLAIAFEDFGAESLSVLIKRRSLSLIARLNIAIQVAAHLDHIHGAQVIHKDINPSNIVINPSTQQVKLIDFGLATVLPRETLLLKPLNHLEGTLAYIAPEQTGRMNRCLDYRSDFYSFGVTCYELFTGTLPFHHDDAVDLVHAHLARQPVPPHHVNSAIPPMLSDIVMTLMAKNAEERYQSAWGIRADLLTCRDQILMSGTVQPFHLKQQDVSRRFQIPQKLYGREVEIATLLDAFERIARPSASDAAAATEAAHPYRNLLLVSGSSGIGKSALVQEIYKPITQHRGYFAVGKFDQLQRNIPYFAIIQAVQGLVKQLLSEDQTQLEHWRYQLSQALGRNGQVLTQVIPDLELIIGTGPTIPDLAGAEAQNRFNLAFQALVQVFAQPQHPLVMFLDDLQWADRASLQLMKLLMSGNDPACLFLMGAYRDHEVKAAHPLRLTLEDIRQSGAIVHEIQLSSLTLEHVKQLASDTLQADMEQVTLLAELLLAKTGGNPFFINELLTEFYSEGLIYFDDRTHRWMWDMAPMVQQNVTDNVVELLTSKLKKQNRKLQTILQVAASIGNQFDLPLLAEIVGDSETAVADVLNRAIASHFIQPLDGTPDRFIGLAPAEVQASEIQSPEIQASKVKTSADHSPDGVQGQSTLGDRPVVLPTLSYRFTHDRVQQASHNLIPEAQRHEIHWQIGQILLRRTPPDQQEQKLFDIVNQLNLCAHRSYSSEQRQELAELNLKAGRKAKTAAAYSPALNYLKAGLAWAGSDIWQTHYELALALYSEAAEAALLCRDFESMETLVATVKRQQRSALDMMQVCEVQIQACIAQERPMEAIALACKFLDRLGVSLPQHPTRWDIERAFWRTRLALFGKPIETLAQLPTMRHPKILAAMRIISRMMTAASLSNPQLFVLLSIQMLNLSIRYGNTSLSAHAYANFGLILCGVRGNVDLGYRFGKLALNLLDRFDARELRAKVLLIVNDYVIPWKQHIGKTLEPFVEAYQIGLETGDLEYAARSAMVYGYHSYFLGRNLQTLESEMKNYSEAIAHLQQRKFFSMNERYRQIVLNLLGQSEHPCRLVGSAYDEETALPSHQQANDKNAIFNLYLHKAILSYLFHRYAEADRFIQKAEPYLGGATGLLLVPIFYFYDALISLAIAPAPASEQPFQTGRLARGTARCQVDLKRVNRSRSWFKRWAKDAPANFLHKLHLIEAERWRVLGHWANAISEYDRAIQFARQHHYINEEAIAHERAAQFYISQKKLTVAQAYLINARYGYSVWGAIAKVDDLNRRYPEMLAPQRSGKPLTSLSGESSDSTSSTLDQALDLNSVIQASQAISSEIDLDKLLIRLMQILVANAGAQQGSLILETRGKLCVEAYKPGDAQSIQVLQSVPLESLQQNLNQASVSPAIVNYVARTQDPVVLNDATREGAFITDPYIQIHRPQSILCIPLLNQGRFCGIIYLENRLVTGAFTPERLEVIHVLSTQAAISIENSRYYSQITELNRAYERFVPSQFLQLLNKDSIIDVQLGDQVQRDMSVLFADIRDFTRLSESMTPQDNFRFINSFLGHMEPIITKHNGFIDKYIGDAIMALFSGPADDALSAAIAMLQTLTDYNQARLQKGLRSIQIGIGINTGSLMLGTVGGVNRMDSTVISDTVNLASRIENLTKSYAASLLITDETFSRLGNSDRYALRQLKAVKVPGKTNPITVYEVFEADPPELKASKLATLDLFNQAVAWLTQNNHDAAAELFQACLDQAPHDSIAYTYWEQCSGLFPNR